MSETKRWECDCGRYSSTTEPNSKITTRTFRCGECRSPLCLVPEWSEHREPFYNQAREIEDHCSAACQETGDGYYAHAHSCAVLNIMASDIGTANRLIRALRRRLEDQASAPVPPTPGHEEGA